MNAYYAGKVQNYIKITINLYFFVDENRNGKILVII